jgi:hypothetical protein
MIGRTLDSMRALLLLLPLLAGCAHHKAPQVAPVNFNSPGIERCLQYWTANFSTHATNHFSVCATEVDRGDLVEALVYWREGGRLLDYCEVPKGAEAQAWRLRPKVDRTVVPGDEQISASNDLVTHRVWIAWVRRCISSGKEYVVPLTEATAAYPRSNQPSSTTAASPAPTGSPASP